jgi:heme/copper-type cytochrome/quinol oxidase subunit 2
MNALETPTNIIVAIEVLAAVVVTWLVYREVRFLAHLREKLGPNADPSLHGALQFSARYTVVVCIWLLALTAIGAAGVNLAAQFPPLRAINGALLLGLLAQPWIVGRALRAEVEAPENVGDYQ